MSICNYTNTQQQYQGISVNGLSCKMLDSDTHILIGYGNSDTKLVILGPNNEYLSIDKSKVIADKVIFYPISMDPMPSGDKLSYLIPYSQQNFYYDPNVNGEYAIYPTNSNGVMFYNLTNKDLIMFVNGNNGNYTVPIGSGNSVLIPRDTSINNYLDGGVFIKDPNIDSYQGNSPGYQSVPSDANHVYIVDSNSYDGFTSNKTQKINLMNQGVYYSGTTKNLVQLTKLPRTKYLYAITTCYPNSCNSIQNSGLSFGVMPMFINDYDYTNIYNVVGKFYEKGDQDIPPETNGNGSNDNGNGGNSNGSSDSDSDDSNLLWLLLIVIIFVIIVIVIVVIVVVVKKKKKT